jgi:hypothetical protein
MLVKAAPLLRVEPEIGVERELHHRRQIVNARHRIPARRSRSRCAAQSNRIDIAAMCLGGARRRRRFGIRAMRPAFANQPPHRAPAFVDDRRDRNGRTQVVIDERDGVAPRHEWQGDEGEVTLVEGAPIAAVPEHERAVRATRRQEKIERFLFTGMAQVDLGRGVAPPGYFR